MAWSDTRFPSPLIKPDVRISRTRLFPDWLHRGHTARGGAQCHERFPCARVASGLATEFPPRSSGSASGVFQAHRQSPHLPFASKTYQKSGSLPPSELPGFNGTTTCPTSALSRCHFCIVEAITSPRTGLPRLRNPLSRRAVPLTPMDRSGCVCRLLPQIVLPSPNSGRVGVHNFPFEACSGFIRITARQVARPPEADPGLRRGRLLSQGFDPADCSTEPPASYRANRPLPGWDLHPQGDRALRGRTGVSRSWARSFTEEE